MALPREQLRATAPQSLASTDKTFAIAIAFSIGATSNTNAACAESDGEGKRADATPLLLAVRLRDGPLPASTTRHVFR